MRLLYFINQIENSGGIERIVIDKVNYLTELPGYELHLAYYGKQGEKSFYPINNAVKLWAIDEDTETTSFVKRLSKVSGIYRKSKEIINAVKPDVIVNANTRIVSYFLPYTFRRIPKVVELHFTYEGLQIMNKGMYGDSKWKAAVNNMLRRYFYARYDKCVVLVNDDVKAWGFKNLMVIPNFTNLAFPSVNNEGREKVVVNVGRLEKQKDHRTLIEAWKLVHKKHPGWKLEIWGDGKLREKLQSLIQKLGLQDCVFLKGVTSEIGKVYARASVFALSSLYEGMPLVAIEAMTAGVPCVSFDISGIRDVITDGEDGLIVEMHIVNAFADGIIRMIEQKEMRAKMSARAKDKVKAFAKERVMRRWTELFEKLKG